MTVKDLIDILHKEDPDLPLVVDVNEVGYDLLGTIKQINIKKNKSAYRMVWDGEFSDTNEGEAGTQKALFLSRKLL